MSSVTIQTNPSWFSIPGEGQLLQDFMRNTTWQQYRGFTMPANKETVTDLGVEYDAEEILLDGKLQNPLRGWGFKKPSFSTDPQWDYGFRNSDAGGRKNFAPREAAGGLIGDNSWGNGGPPNNWPAWNFDFVAGGYGIAYLDYENNNISTTETTNRMRQGKEQCLAAGTKLGLWAQGLCGRFALQELTPFPSGVYNSAGAAQWVSMYNTPGLVANSHAYGPDLDVSCIFWYETMYYDPKLLYSVIVNHELSKILKPTVLSTPTIWHEAESIDGLEQHRIEFIKPANAQHGRLAGFWAQHARGQTPASMLYAQTLWCLLVCDGYYLFDAGRGSINDIGYCWGSDNGTSPLDAVKEYKGVNNIVYCPVKYQGFLNYVALANWQVSQSPIKQMLEDTSTAWSKCEYQVTTGANVWRTGHSTASPTTAFTFASWACLREEPLIRVKMNAANTQLLFIAQNPHNDGLETVNMRNLTGVGVIWSVTIQLNGAWPTWGIINV